MGNEDESRDVEGYILNSKYRSAILEYLATNDQATPTEIAESVGEPRPHISRALSELKDQNVVELRVPDGRNVGRYYGLTKKGRGAWPDIEEQTRDITWEIVEPTDEKMKAVVSSAQNKFGDRLRVVGYYDGNEVSIPYAKPEVLEGYTDAEFEEGIRTLVLEHTLENASLPNEQVLSETIHLTEYILIRVRIDQKKQIVVSVDHSNEPSNRTFTDEVVSIFED